MDEGSTLKLIMDKGPRAGETLDFTSRSVIKIGRVVRGNTIAVKDNGISSKHLSIKFDSGAGHWTLQDLESSNGTFLNDFELVPLQPAAIKDGDTIKIGEITSISVKIEMGEMSRLRRNPSRRGKGGEGENVASQSGGGSELGLESGGDLGGNVVEIVPVKRNLRGRPRKVAGSKNEAEEVEVKQVRKTRSSKNKVQNVEFNPTLPTVPESLADGTDYRELGNFVEGEAQKVQGRKNLRDASLKNVRNGDLDTAAIDGSLPSGSTEAIKVDAREKSRVPIESNSGGEVCDNLKKVDDVREVVDLEKMTLGEWFDYLEVYLPKQIYDETEAMILKMKEDAAKFHEFRLHKENANDKGKQPMD